LSLSVMKKPLARDDPPTWNDLPAAWRENSDQMKRVAKLALSPKKSIERKKPPVGKRHRGPWAGNHTGRYEW